ncbi:MAG: hypothetical protein ABW185_04515 [Sedimenticola sp.]
MPRTQSERNNRKRHLSLPSDTDINVKKIRSRENDTGTDTVVPKQRINTGDDVIAVDETIELLDSEVVKGGTMVSNKTDKTNNKVTTKNTEIMTSPKNKHTNAASDSFVLTQADVHMSADVNVRDVLVKISADMHAMWLSLSDRMSALESSIEKRVSAKLMNTIDKRMNSETTRLKKDIDSRFANITATLTADIDGVRREINKTTNRKSDSANNGHERESNLNVIVRNLPESQNENIIQKLTAVVKDGLRLNDVVVTTAERKSSYSNSIPGVVVAKVGTAEQVSKIMKAKYKLKDNTQYRKVFIHTDKTKAERRMESSMRAVVDAVKRGDTNIAYTGNRIVRDTARSRTDGTRNYGEARHVDHRLPRTGGEDGPHYAQHSHGYDNRNARQTRDYSDRRSDGERERREVGRDTGREYSRRGNWRGSERR